MYIARLLSNEQGPGITKARACFVPRCCSTAVRRAYTLAGPTSPRSTVDGITQGICELQLPAAEIRDVHCRHCLRTNTLFYVIATWGVSCLVFRRSRIQNLGSDKAALIPLWLWTVCIRKIQENKVGHNHFTKFPDYVTGWAVSVRIPAGVRGLSLLRNVRTGSGVHPASYSMSTKLLPGGKVAGIWRWPLTPSRRGGKESTDIF
jgi:hypothetical protein